MLRIFAFFGFSVFAFFILVSAVAGFVFLTTPKPSNIRSCFTTSMRQVHLCQKDRGYTRLANISPHLRNAVIVAEDAAFYGHSGFDWHELQVSLKTNWERGRLARGGSTITQQLAKNLYLSDEKSWLRKIREAIIATQIEEILSKNEILEKYLNVVEFGKDLYGINRASWFYFQKSPAFLSPLESSFLAFLLPNPQKHATSFHRKTLSRYARQRMKVILYRLKRYRRITPGDYELALSGIDSLFSSNPFSDVSLPEDPNSVDTETIDDLEEDEINGDNESGSNFFVEEASTEEAVDDAGARTDDSKDSPSDL